MKEKQRDKEDTFEKEIEFALNPGAFIRYGACFSFVGDLEGVAAKIAKLTKTDPSRAAVFYETFLAGCYEKAEELDDSGGSFGQFVEDLFCDWIRARQASGADPDKTAARLLVWMDDDPYGFCYQLEKDAAKAFDKAGLAAFEKRIRERFDAAVSAKPAADASFRNRPEYVRRRCGEVLRTIYLEQKNVAAYVALAGETGLTAEDCRAVATMLASRRKQGEALAWVDRGIELDEKAPHGSIACYDLASLRRELLVKLGRREEALDDTWEAYRNHPGKYTYEDLMKYVPKAERSTWHEKAIDAAMGTDIPSLVELLLETKEIARLAEVIRRAEDGALEKMSHYYTEPAAKKLEKNHPDLAARLWRGQGMRIVNAKKSKYYDAAISNFERAKLLYERAGLTADWEKIVSLVRAEHHRKKKLMRGFEELVAGHGPSDKPSFLERAKARWEKRLEKGEK